MVHCLSINSTALSPWHSREQSCVVRELPIYKFHFSIQSPPYISFLAKTRPSPVLFVFFPLPPWLMLTDALLNQGSLSISWASWCKGGDREQESCTKRRTLVALLICMQCTPSFHTQARLPGVQGRTEGHGVSGIPVKWTCSTAENTQVHMHCTHIVRMHTYTHRHSGKRYKTRLFPGERWLMMMFSNARFKLRFFSCTLTNTFLLCVP